MLLAAILLALFAGGQAAPVGFRIMSASRGDRRVQIAVWYPAAGSGLLRMTYRDYVERTANVEELRSFLTSARVSRSDVEQILATPMNAVPDAPAAKGTSRLVLLSQGNGQSAPDQAFLAESLASHGFTVAATPSASRISGPMKSEEDITAKAEEQAADLAFAAGKVKTRAELDREGMAVVGHSFGARAALLLAMSDPSVRALVSLDGGIGAKTGKGMLERSRLFDAKAMRAPILHFYEELDPFMAPDFSLLDSLSGSRRFLVRVPATHHAHFTSVGPLSSGAPSLAAVTGTTEETRRSVEAVERSTVSFLDAFFNRPGGWKPEPPLTVVEMGSSNQKEGWVSGPRGRLRLDDGGSGGLPLLFVHGNGGNRTQWAAQLEHFRKSRRAAAFDLRGMGESERASDADYSVEGFASDVATVADALKMERFVLVGHSYGGAVAAAYAGGHSERLAGLVFADVAGDLRKTPAAQVDRLRKGLEPATYEEFTRRWFETILAKGTEATKAAVMKSLRATPREVFVAATTGLYSFDSEGALARSPGPRLHIASFLAGNPRAIDRSAPGMPVRTVADASHWLMMDRADEFNRILEEFLATLK